MASTDRALAFAILRFTLGINIFVHGLQRVPHGKAFVQGMISQFGGVLPAGLVGPFAVTVVPIEMSLGALLVVGLAQRGTLVLGALYMAALTFGTALLGKHDILAEQLGYELVYAALLATLTWDRFSLDALIARGRATKAPPQKA